MARGAFSDVLLAIVTKRHRDSLRRIQNDDWFLSELMTAAAVVIDRRLRFPVTIEARSVIGGR